MTDASPALTRIASLIAMTAIFAGLWANDGPGSSAIASRPSLSEPVVQIERTSAHDVQLTAISVEGTIKEISLETENLLVSKESLQNHLNQLPLGLPVGDYRMVDSLGGVGWLRVRISSNSGARLSDGRVDPLLTTSTEDSQVRFIRVQKQIASSSLPRTVR
ncbi:MAG: hypothetical protein KDA80_02645 [Planctomycetaceae bacterium]|nr:hypothetical protein [Planctomycetaceae bacterium]